MDSYCLVEGRTEVVERRLNTQVGAADTCGNLLFDLDCVLSKMHRSVFIQHISIGYAVRTSGSVCETHDHFFCVFAKKMFPENSDFLLADLVEHIDVKMEPSELNIHVAKS